MLRVSQRYMSAVTRYIPETRKEDLVTQLRDMCAIASDIWEGLHVEFQTDIPSLFVETDIDAIIENVNELILNAWKAKATQIYLQLGYVASSEMFKITIKDNGRGIPPSVQSKLYEPDITKSQNSTGLGLSIVREVFETLGGNIALHSTGKNGTMFILQIPIRLNAQTLRRREK